MINLLIKGLGLSWAPSGRVQCCPPALGTLPPHGWGGWSGTEDGSFLGRAFQGSDNRQYGADHVPHSSLSPSLCRRVIHSPWMFLVFLCGNVFLSSSPIRVPLVVCPELLRATHADASQRRFPETSPVLPAGLLGGYF